uniref:Uncharacterized protein n=3 Tax=Aegilops tauschii subsp. strangulata TaxID=200361 RepID=A0A453DBQ2_AEGTS
TLAFIIASLRSCSLAPSLAHHRSTPRCRPRPSCRCQECSSDACYAMSNRKIKYGDKSPSTSPVL